jgi:ribosomal protein L14
MLNIGTKLRVADNSGGVIVKCLHTTKTKRGNIYPGDIITVVVQKNKYKPHVVKKSKIITKGMICKALVVRTTRGVRR